MSFQSLSFLAFLALTAIACTLLRRRSALAGQAALGAACLIFYLSGGGWAAFAVLCAGCVVTALAARAVERSAGTARRRVFAAGSLYHVAVLLAFKYTGFFTGGALSIGWAPLGLSFFTFQQLWLLREVYMGRFTLQSPWALALASFFFPTVTSGPILRPSAIFPQIASDAFLRPDWTDAAAGLYGICCGTAKKVLLADPLGAVVGSGWSDLASLSATDAWLVILGYTMQLYFDFSGYCDIAAGAARLLGVRLPLNFDSPYRSLSVGEFWKRWHMTLTTFLRENVYFPLGGSRRGAWRTYRNILIVYLVSGFWHGAGWTFLVWGALHGLAQIAERAWGSRRERLPGWLQWGLTFLFVNIAWVFFRAPSLGDALTLLTTAFTGGVSLPGAWLMQSVFERETSAVGLLFPALESAWLAWGKMALLYGAACAAALLPARSAARRMEDFVPPPAWRTALLALAAGWAVLSFTGITTFIYSNF